MASIDYYGDEDKWGNYQYTTLEDIINDYSMARSSDDYTADTPRHQILYQAMKGLRELYYDVVQEVSGISLELSPSLQVTLPPDYVNYVRISWLDDMGRLHPMAIDNKMSMANNYLQDSQYRLLFDDNGCVLMDDGTDSDLENPSQGVSTKDLPTCYTFCYDSFQPNRNLANVYRNGRYTIDKNKGVIQFGSDVKGRIIVLEYISDGLYTGCEGRPENERRINKFAESALLDFIYYQLIKNRRSVPANEKIRAKKEYHNSRRIAKSRINTLRKDELLQIFRGSSKWIK